MHQSTRRPDTGWRVLCTTGSFCQAIVSVTTVRPEESAHRARTSMDTSTRRQFGACLAALALTASACGGSGTATPTPELTVAPATPTVVAPDAADSTGDTTPAPLTASYRGVTETTITVGVAIANVNLFAPEGDLAPRIAALAAATNAAGGINGRTIEVITETWDLLDQSGFRAACTRLTEDEEVFLVIGFLVANWGDVGCYTNLHETLVINYMVPKDDEIAAAAGRQITTEPSELRLLLEGMDALTPEIAGSDVVLFAVQAGDDRVSQAEEKLNQIGAASVSVTNQQTGGAEDLVSAQAELDVHIERWRTNGTDIIIALDGNAAVGLLPALERAGMTDITVVTPTIDVPTLTALGADLSATNIIGVAAPAMDSLARAELYGIPDCITTVTAATGETIVPSPPDGEIDALASTIRGCAAWDIFVAGVTAAGPTLTEQSFLQGLYDLGEYDQTGSVSGSVSSAKVHSSNHQAEIYVWDAVQGQFTLR